jgi:penicillin-binding protein 1A
MTENDRTGYSSVATDERVASVLSPARPRERRRRRGLFRRRTPRRRIRWLRLLAILVPLSFLALVSSVFGMVLAFAPQLGPLVQELNATYKNGLNSIIYSNGYNTQEIGILTSHNQFFLPADRIPLLMDHAIVAVEDKRFYTEPGIDYRGIARAFVADVLHTGGGTQGGSTITEQFVKNALGVEETSHRTIFNKLREAALAFQLTHLWPKSKILAEYLNTAYFGNGAYGIEAAARAYFGNDRSSSMYGCGKAPDISNPYSLCVTYLTGDEAALLAGMVAAPTELGNDLFNNTQPVYHRRNLVLQDMYEQGYLTQAEYLTDSQLSLPPPADIQSPSEEDVNPSAGYFTQWIENQLLVKYGQSIYSAGYHIHTTLDWDLQGAAQAIVNRILPPDTGGPAASLVAIDNKTGDVTAMVGGYDFATSPFNLATQAERQPGSAFKVFDLAAALASGHYGYDTPVLSKQFTYTAQAVPFGDFSVHNDEHSYFNADIPLWEALALSDNSVFARVGLSVGESAIADYAKQFGISTTISLNPSMVIGGLHIGVTPLDMAHAYETIANWGNLTTGNLASTACAGGPEPAFLGPAPQPNTCPGPNGIDFIAQHGGTTAINKPYTIPTNFPSRDARTEIDMMRNVITDPDGTGAAAEIPGVTAWGKTGTTTNYVDAWFIGSTAASGAVPSMTIAVWVGYPKSGSKSMAKDFGGKPVYGGTYPALIWRAYVLAAIAQYKAEAAGRAAAHTQSPSKATSSTGAAGVVTPAGATTVAGSASSTAAPGATSTRSPATGATTPAAGTVTSGGGSSAPPTTGPAGATTPAAGTGSPPAGGTTTPPATTTGGGVAAPGGGTTAPSG